MKNLYEEVNAGDAKNLQVVVISGDKDEAGFNASMAGMPWVALPFGNKGSDELKALVPCTGYPTPGILKGDGTVINADAFGADFADQVRAAIAA